MPTNLLSQASSKREQQLTSQILGRVLCVQLTNNSTSQPHTIGVHQRPQLAADSVRAADVAAAEALRGDAGGVAAAAIGRLEPGRGPAC